MSKKRKSSFQVLKENRKPLNKTERSEVMKRGAVWHQGKNGAPSPAIWKSENSKGDTVFVTNTHRDYGKAPTLKGAINKFHRGIKQTA